jgi:hypothetical protein
MTVFGEARPIMLLDNSTVKRAGVTAKYWTHGTNDIDLDVGMSAINLSFAIDSKGGGQTQIELEIRHEDFAVILATMSAANRQAALLAMCNELARCVKEHPSLEQQAMERGQGVGLVMVENAALEKFTASHFSSDVYMIISEMTKEIWAKMNKSK